MEKVNSAEEVIQVSSQTFTIITTIIALVSSSLNCAFGFGMGKYGWGVFWGLWFFFFLGFTLVQLAHELNQDDEEESSPAADEVER